MKLWGDWAEPELPERSAEDDTEDWPGENPDDDWEYDDDEPISSRWD